MVKIIKEIIDGLCARITETVGDGYEIYTQTMEQGMVKPCFFIMCDSSKEERFLGKRYKCSSKINIEYLSNTKDKYDENYKFFEDIRNALEYIYIDGNLTKVNIIDSKIGEDSFNLALDIKLFIYKEETVEKMEKLEIEGEFKYE